MKDSFYIFIGIVDVPLRNVYSHYVEFSSVLIELLCFRTIATCHKSVPKTVVFMDHAFEGVMFKEFFCSNTAYRMTIVFILLEKAS